MRKYVFILGLCIALNVFLCAYTLNGACYVTLETNLGTQTIYIPVSYVYGSFCLDSDGLPVNITGSSITGYTLDDSGSREYRITINPFGETWTYRLNSGSSYTSSNLTIDSLVETNIEFVTMESIEGDKIPYEILFCALLCVGVVICFMKTS